METEYDYLLEKYGFDHLVLKYVEEQSEFVTALLHAPKTNDWSKVYDELADLQIMIDRIIYSLDCYNQVSEYKVKNLMELKNRVKSGEL